MDAKINSDKIDPDGWLCFDKLHYIFGVLEPVMNKSLDQGSLADTRIAQQHNFEATFTGNCF
jgi:hypothetical protein